MHTTANLLRQRSTGDVHIRMGQSGPRILREAGAAKCRLPPGSSEAILINTSGGLAGGDTVSIIGATEENARLTLTSQAAERVYRSIGPPAQVSVQLDVANGSTLFWAPQETILFEGAALSRKLEVQLEANATFLAVETMVFGRLESGEQVQALSVRDDWRIFRDNRLVHAEAFSIGPDWTNSIARVADARAMATVLLVAPSGETRLDAVRRALGPQDGASAWNGKLVARLLAKDGFTLRKTLIQVLHACVAPQGLPKCWTF